MRFCILLLVFTGSAFAQGFQQGTWSADNDNPPGLEEARAKNYEENLRPPEKHPPAYYTADYYEYQVDRKVTFESRHQNSSPKEEEQNSSASNIEKNKPTKDYAGGGYVQGRRINSRNCTYTCNKKLSKYKPKGLSNKSGANGNHKTYRGSNWYKRPSMKYTHPKMYSSVKTTTRRPSSSYKYKRKSPTLKTRKYTAPVFIRKKHTKKPSISKKVEGSNLR